MTKSGFNRLHTITQKIGREQTGLNGSLFAHVDFRETGVVDAVRFSEKGKDSGTLDAIFTALGDAATEIIKSFPGRAG
jgi:hypothetical protein